MTRTGWSVGLASLLLAWLGFAAVALAVVSPHEMTDEEKLQRAKALYLEGQRAFERGEPEFALVAWEEAYNEYVPMMHVFSFNIGQAALEAGDCVKARVAFQRFLDLVAEHPARAEAAEHLLIIERSGCAGSTAPTSNRIVMGRDSRAPMVGERLEIQIDHQHAHGVLRRRFDNHAGRTIEGAFEFGGVSGTHVVGFAYWNRDEKIVGQVYEKRVATRIYEGTVRRRRDPGLLVSAGDGLFRFTVFPIFAGERKQVELHFEQWLSRHGKEVELRVPLQSTTANIDITLGDERSPTTFRSPTHQIAVGRQDDGNFRIRSGRARPDADALVLRWTLDEEPGTLRSFVHRDPGQDAYLVLTVVAPVYEGVGKGQGLRDLRLSTRGLEVHSMHPRSLPEVAAGEELVVVARVEGSGTLDVRLTGFDGRGPFTATPIVTISERASRPWVGRVWARRRVEFLLDRIEQGGGSMFVDEALELSLAYDIVTPYTAFLAMPENELMADTAELMLGARRHKRRILAEYPDATAIRGAEGSAGGAFVAGDYESSELEAQPQETPLRADGSAGCASCRAGQGPQGTLGLMFGLLLLVRRRKARASGSPRSPIFG